MKAIQVIGLSLAMCVAACGRAPSQPPANGAPSGSQPQITISATTVPSLTLQASQIVLRDIASDKEDPYNEPDGEPSIAINPRNPKEIAVLAFSGNWGSSLGVAAPIWKSLDGGMTWRKRPFIPPPKPLTLGPPINRTVRLSGPSDQSLAYDSAGRLIVAEMGTDIDDQNFTLTILYRQTGGHDDPLVQTPALFGDGIVDQPFVASGADTCADRTYAAWLNTANQRSMHSLAWNDALSSRDVADELKTRTTRLAVSRSRAAYLVYAARVPESLTGDSASSRVPRSDESVSFRVRRSDDCGSSWNALGETTGVTVHTAPKVRSLNTKDFAGLQSRGLSFQPRAESSDAWITVHRETGDVYVAHLDVKAGVSRIVMARSTDKGRTWSSADVIDHTTMPVMSAYPEIAVNSDGVVGILFIDFVGTGDSLAFRHRFAMSADKGVSWSFSTLQTMTVRQLADTLVTLEKLAKKRDAHSLIPPELWGDFEALTTSGSTFYGVFTGASIGRRVTELDPILFTVDAHAVPLTTTDPPIQQPPAPVAPPPSPPDSHTYSVVEGDSLWKIAKKKSPGRKGATWHALYDANRSTIKRPRLIKPNQQFRLPW